MNSQDLTLIHRPEGAPNGMAERIQAIVRIDTTNRVVADILPSNGTALVICEAQEARKLGQFLLTHANKIGRVSP